MTLIEEWITDLIAENYVQSFYRFQGGNSYRKFSYNDKKLTYDTSDKYTYLSKGKKHHEYFVRRRINQMVLEYAGYNPKKGMIYRYCPELPDIKQKFEEINEEEFNLEVISFHFIREAFKLIQNNSFICDNTGRITKEIENIPERIDPKKYDGGYGLNKDWLRLFYLSTICTDYTPINKEDIMNYLNQLAYTTNAKAKVTDNYKKRFFLSDNIESPFTKYELIETLENIVLTRTLLPDSELAKEPKKTIKTFVKKYEATREKALYQLDLLMKNKYQ